MRDRQPLVGTGPLPTWLRNLAYSRSMLALDAFQDNLCLWRCLAVHRGARADCSTQAERQLAQDYFKRPCRDCPKTSLDELDKVERHLNQGRPLGIRVYEPERKQDGSVFWFLRRNVPFVKLQNIMTIGVFEGRAFLIKDIERLGSKYVRKDCFARFTQSGHLQRHTQTCPRGETKIYCPNERIEAPQTVFEQAFFPDPEASNGAIFWLENESRWWRIHIHHAQCGHRGERLVEGGLVDGFHSPSKTVFQYHGCYYHGCLKCYPDRERHLAGGKKAKELYAATRSGQQLFKKRVSELSRSGRVITLATHRNRESRSQNRTRTPSSSISRRLVAKTVQGTDGHHRSGKRARAHFRFRRGHARVRSHAHLRKRSKSS